MRVVLFIKIIKGLSQLNILTVRGYIVIARIIVVIQWTTVVIVGGG